MGESGQAVPSWMVNGAWRKWSVIITAAGFIFVFGGFIFSAGRTDASLNQRLTRVEEEVQLARSEYARRDVVEQRLTFIEKAQEKIERNEDEQARKLDEILLEERKKIR